MYVTQAGDRYRKGGYNFPHALRQEELEMSLTIGRLTPAQACDLRATAEAVRNTARDAARYALVGRLEELKFRIEATPTDVNPDHVSAYWDDGPWDAAVASLFCRAFQAPQPPQGDVDE